MAPTIVHFEIPATDADRAQGFYAGIFGWQVADGGFEGVDYRMVQGEPGGALYPSEEGGKGILVYFGTQDIEATLREVGAGGGEAGGKQPIPGIGWFAHCKDTEGNAFGVFESDESVPAG